MRVIAGIARSIPLKAPKGDHTRPTIDKHKETLFNCLSERLYDSVFVDLYSGSGAIGIEALSRGAKRAYFIENNTEAVNCIKENLNKTRLSDKAVLKKGDAKTFLLNGLPEKADIVFMDPPFAEHAEAQIIPLIVSNNLLSEEGIIVVECESGTKFDYLEDLGLNIYKVKDYKSCSHVFIERASNELIP